jgi:hypothetical protein
MFIDVICKLGNMKKPQEFTIYPEEADRPHLVLIQSDKRIAQIDLNSGKGVLSDGKGGHQGFWKLQAAGAMAIEVPPDVVAEIRRLMDVRRAGPKTGLSGLVIH